jgi:hypothetical protein
MKSLFQINSPSRAYAWLLGFAVARSIMDYFWVPDFGPIIYKVFVLFNYTVYLFTLYLLIPAMTGFILEKISTKPVDHTAVLRESVLVWVVYPLVAIISLMFKSPAKQTIEWFRYIPTFMVHNNFLPAGMIAVIPILIVFYTWLLMRHSGANWLKTCTSVILSLWVVYLLYYQYLLRLFYYFHYYYGPIFAFGFFTLSFLIPLFPLAGRFHAAFGDHRITLPRLVLISTIISLVLMGVGLFQAILLSGTNTRSLLSW